MPSSNRMVSIDRYVFARARQKGMGLDLHLLAMAVAFPFSIKLKRFLTNDTQRKKTKDTFAFLFYQKLILIISLIQYVSPIAFLQKLKKKKTKKYCKLIDLNDSAFKVVICVQIKQKINRLRKQGVVCTVLKIFFFIVVKNFCFRKFIDTSKTNINDVGSLFLLYP